MKKIIIYILGAAVTVSAAFGTQSAYAAPEISAQYACVIESESGDVIYEKNANEKHSMASTTKIMTALMAIEHNCMDDIVTASSKASVQEGSSIYLSAGDKMLMKDLIYGLMLNSGNDAAVAIAEHISGSVEKFAEDMTAKAKEFGANNTSFKNPNGLDAKGHYTTAYDLAIISRKAMQNETFARIVATKTGSVTPINRNETTFLRNHNKLLSMYPGANGIKTGYTMATGRCLVSSAERDGMKFIAVTLNAPNDWNDHKMLLDYAFSVCEKKELVKPMEVIKEMETEDGRKYNIVAEDGYSATVMKGKEPTAELDVKIADGLKEPINKDERVGMADIVYRGDVIKRIRLISDRDVYAEKNKSKNILDYLSEIVHNWLMH